MQSDEDTKTRGSFTGMQSVSGMEEKEPMHPDDFRGLFAWVTAKRFHELHG